jgi:alpha-amylase
VFNKDSRYFNEDTNKQILQRVSDKCYLPANRIIMDLIDDLGKEFRLAFSLTGVFVEQCLKYQPEVLESFKNLAETGNVEFLGETYYHSLSSLFSKKEFEEQIGLHTSLMKDIFNYKPEVFRNTEALYSNEIARTVKDLGFRGIMAEGHENILEWRSPNYLHVPRDSDGIRIIPRNYRLSDDIGFRFSDISWSEFPLTAEKYASWLYACKGDTLNLFLDYETFGEHHWKETGILDFLKALPYEILKYDRLDFKSPSQLIGLYDPVGFIDVPHTISWADIQRDTSAWLENDMQKYAFRRMAELEEAAKKNSDLLQIWRKLQTSDHFYYMCTKWFADGDVHKYFNPYESPYDAFINYINVLQHLQERLRTSQAEALKEN